MEGTGRNEVRREVRRRKKLPHLAAAIGLAGSDVRAFVDGRRCRFTGGARLDVGIGERAAADEETKPLDVFTAAIPEDERTPGPDLHGRRKLNLRIQPP